MPITQANLLESRPVNQTYSQPTVLWKLIRGADVARAVFVPHTIKSTLVVFKNDSIYHIEDIEEWSTALERSVGTRERLIRDGWRDEE